MNKALHERESSYERSEEHHPAPRLHEKRLARNRKYGEKMRFSSEERRILDLNVDKYGLPGMTARLRRWPFGAPQSKQDKSTMARLAKTNSSKQLPKSRTGIQGLDEITGGGLPNVQSTLISGGAELPHPVRNASSAGTQE